METAGFCKQNGKHKKITGTLKRRWKRLQGPDDHSYSLTDHFKTVYEETNGPNGNSVRHQIKATRNLGCDVLIIAENSGLETHGNCPYVCLPG